MTADADVVVVGAGLAGLTAARTLLGAGASVVVVEARNRAGGRTHPVAHDGRLIEYGGQSVGPTQDHALGLLALVSSVTVGRKTSPAPLLLLLAVAAVVTVYVRVYVPRLERREAEELAVRRAAPAAARAARKPGRPVA